MSIFRKFLPKKVHVRFSSDKAGEVTLFGREQIETFKALKNGHVYEAIAYRDQFERFESVNLILILQKLLLVHLKMRSKNK